MPRSAKEEAPNRELLTELVSGGQRAGLLKAALELETFTRLAEGYQSIPALTRATGWSERGTRLLLDALVALGLVSRTASEYTLTPTSETLLIKGGPTYIGDWLLTGMNLDARGQIMRAVRTGRAQPGAAGDMFDLARAQRTASELLEIKSQLPRGRTLWESLQPKLLAIDLREPTKKLRVMGLGCDTCIPLLSIATCLPAEITLFDSQPVLAAMAQIVEALEISESVAFIPAENSSAGWQVDSFDLSWLGPQTQSLGIEQNIGLFRRVYEALSEGGLVLLETGVGSVDGQDAGWNWLASLSVSLARPEGEHYTLTEYGGLLEAAGFSQVERLTAHPGLVVAHRKSSAHAKTGEPVNAAVASETAE